MIIITKNAKKYFNYLLNKKKIGTQIYLFINNPGTQFAECGISYYNNKQFSNDNIRIKYDNLFIYINKNHIIYFKNSKIDVIKNELELQLILKVPNAKKKIIKKNKILKNKIINVLNNIINPQLKQHNGYVFLIDITTNKDIILEFKGNCNGCSMSNITLKEIIEKKIKKLFPEINNVLDFRYYKKK
ncbi:Fe/S biogenesis protein NfuA [Candidatus Annandia adelgestsuga]|uniref:Fe/S biogenesis protein NfuA n=1 Tax=Candidatus Annandia adelgestsuga TaxID=1302411 RepID=A0A3S9J7S0_9ENTR|nr:NifU family protein [Candidatus Annandia adelgestsuga]AZP36282.1 Fe/S biogenesis protein NfuA [Candidatus Annandia adelgestsuga]